ncbi:MAG: S49 family peptidase [Planctomycetota bacterium]
MRTFILLFLSIVVWAGEAPQGTVVVELSGSLQLRPAESLFGDGEMSLHEATMCLRDAMAAPEPRVVLDLSRGFEPGVAAAEELAGVLRERRAGKSIVCLIDGLTDAALIVASVCDEVVMPKSGTLAIHGLTLESWYLAPALAKLGVRFHAVASGPFKSAPEMFTRAGPSDDARVDHRQLLASRDRIVVGLSQHAGFTATSLERARATGLQTAAMAEKLGLVLSQVDQDAWMAAQPEPVRHAKKGRDIPDLSTFSGLMRFWGELLGGDGGAARPPRSVAVVELAGMILPGEHSTPGESICDGDTVALFDRLGGDKRVVAVVLRIDSGGGDAGASERIHNAVRRLDAIKPVVCLMDGVAASGGYMIACAAREIRCHRSTITGSIGVFALIPDVDGTLDLLGVHRYVETTSPRGDILHPGNWSPDKEVAFRDVVVDVDQRFRAMVTERRKFSGKRIDKLAEGRVFTGDQAVAEGLADGIGTLTTTVARARQLVNEPAPLPLERFPKNGGLAARLGLTSTLAIVPHVAQLPVLVQLARRNLIVMAWNSFGEVR